MPSPAYALRFSDGARTARRALPPEAVGVLLDRLEEIAANPATFAAFTQELVAGSGIFVYKPNDPAIEVTYRLLEQDHVLEVVHFAAPAFASVKPLFISYCHNDAEWLTRVKKYLTPLEQQGLIRVWDDQRIQAGADWIAEIRKALESARAAVLLVSQDFLLSDFIRQQEVPALLESAKNRGTQILWVPVRASTVRDSPLMKYEAALPPDKPLATLPDSEVDQALVELYEKVKKAVEPRPN